MAVMIKASPKTEVGEKLGGRMGLQRATQGDGIIVNPHRIRLNGEKVRRHSSSYPVGETRAQSDKLRGQG